MGRANELIVIDVFEDGTSSPTTIGASRSVVGMRGLSGQTLSGSVKLAHAVHAITSFPCLSYRDRGHPRLRRLALIFLGILIF